ncbi:MAG: hypothetical protein Q4B26_11665 [Eubacteriales bacterium]|nr:hypothetical protein [Eubacteriales bacterium]
MSSDMKQYKCPSCGGPMHFDSAAQQLLCEYCKNTIDIDGEDLENFFGNLGQEDINWQQDTSMEWQQGEADQLRTFYCESCGGELTTDNNTVATSCPYCGNPVMLMERVSGDLRPNYVIPFQIDKEGAKKAYREHLKGKRLLPKSFKDENHIDEIKGVYVPFWMFDSGVHGTYRFRGTKKAVWTSGNYIYTKTSYYSVFLEGSTEYANIPIDGSKKMPDDLMESIEPFDFSKAVSFNTAYLAGYLADKYDVSAQESVSRANERIRTSTRNQFRNQVYNLDSVQMTDERLQYVNARYQYALLPVWLLSSTWNGKNFIFAMNGQTGKMVGDLPADPKKRMMYFSATTVITMLIALLVIFLVH